MMKFQVVVNKITFRTGLGGGKPSVDSLHHAPVPLALVFQLPTKLTPASVLNTFGKFVVPYHATNIQVLNLDEAVFSCEPCTQLVGKVLTAGVDLFVFSGQPLPGFLSVLTVLLFARKGPMSLLDTPLRLAVETRIVYLFASGADSEVGQTQVNPDLWANELRVRHFFLDLDAQIVFAALAFRDDKSFRFTFNWSMKDSPYPAHFGQIEARTLNLEVLGDGDALFVFSTMVAWIAFWHPVLASFFTRLGQCAFVHHLEELFVGRLQVAKRTLQGLGITHLKPPEALGSFQAGEHLVCRCVAQTFAMLQVMFLANSQEVVVDKTSLPKVMGQQAFLFFGWVDAKLIRGFDQQERRLPSIELVFLLYHIWGNVAHIPIPALKRRGDQLLKPLYPRVETAGVYGLFH